LPDVDVSSGVVSGDFLCEAVILLDDIVEIFHLKDLDERPQAQAPQEKCSRPTSLAPLVYDHPLRDALVAACLHE
jgi:hypothetical protein